MGVLERQAREADKSDIADNHDMRAMSRQAKFVAARNIPPSRDLSRSGEVLIYDTSLPPLTP